MPAVPLPPDPHAANRAWWEAAAAAHRRTRGGYYDPDALVHGDDRLTPEEEEALARALPGGLPGARVLHCQCHLALDGIRMARRGARVTGLDLSGEALAGAADLARACGVDLTLVQAEATDPPASLEGRFDLVWATVGVLTWHPALGPWMAAAARCLRPGGRLVLHELHPLYTMPARLAPLACDFPYGGGEGRAFLEEGTYAAPQARLGELPNTSWAWSLGEIVSAAAQAGLAVLHLEEHLHASFDPRGGLLPREADGRFRWRLPGVEGEVGLPVPVLFTLVAERGLRSPGVKLPA